MGFALRCPDCRGKFPWDPNTKFPRFCPVNGCDLGEERAEDGVVMPFIRSAKTKANDQVYRQMETASERRAEAAAEMLGVPASDMSDMKITNLNDRRDAEVAAMPVNNAVSQQMDLMRASGGQAGFVQTGAEYSAAVQQGPFPNAGAKMRSLIHQSNGAVSDRPALETLQPGYRVRG